MNFQNFLGFWKFWIVFLLIYPKSPKAVLSETLPKSGTKKDHRHRRETIAMPRFYGRGFIAMLLDSTAEGL